MRLAVRLNKACAIANKEAPKMLSNQKRHHSDF